MVDDSEFNGLSVPIGSAAALILSPIGPSWANPKDRQYRRKCAINLDQSKSLCMCELPSNALYRFSCRNLRNRPLRSMGFQPQFVGSNDRD